MILCDELPSAEQETSKITTIKSDYGAITRNGYLSDHRTCDETASHLREEGASEQEPNNKTKDIASTKARASMSEEAWIEQHADGELALGLLFLTIIKSDRHDELCGEYHISGFTIELPTETMILPQRRCSMNNTTFQEGQLRQLELVLDDSRRHQGDGCAQTNSHKANAVNTREEEDTE
ncbi:hypothetical protein PROFUN_06581 [Planoprotostelium fungivorum]|uniref:Uncharacterized protein n=1 Tax=Planoprotostelium fungivorum TaxID=1890364 RepID=A0A2P6MRX3_9EUKA|nr:hypothetical protein PROFUN_06581 [Planoprotostelium fungivorum]